MFDNNHHQDGHIALWIPAPSGHQEALISTRPDTFFRPPYVGVKGWIGVELSRIDDEELAELLREAWQLIAAKLR
jgi:hypothetical protein